VGRASEKGQLVFEKEGYVSIWIGREVPDASRGLDILKDLCGVDYYDLDFQEVVGDEGWPAVPVESLLERLSYSASYLSGAVAAARRLGIPSGRWAVLQLNFDYRPDQVAKPIAADPVFLGSFPWHE
jgi:hypothetical protein